MSCVWISNNEIRLAERISEAVGGEVLKDPVPPANYAVLIQHRAAVAVHSPINLTKELVAPRDAFLIWGNGYRSVTPHPRRKYQKALLFSPVRMIKRRHAWTRRA